jgi:uncharacterized membrane protein YdjX (TVP38/TMEM64 family)
VLLLRLLPGPAYPLVSFAAGYARLSFPRYLAASSLGSSPSIAMLVLAGELATRAPLLALGLTVLAVGGFALAGWAVERRRRIR